MTADLAMDLQRRVDSIKWFHSIDFGNGVVARGTKSAELLSQEADAFLGAVSLHGRSFLDVGTWNGFFSFEAKRRGAARVLATDHFAWNYPNEAGREGFELARQQLGYEIEAEDIDVPALTADRVGLFDVVLFAGVFYHLFEAPKLMKQVSELASMLFVVESHQDLHDVQRPAMVYYPGATLANDETNFWGPNPLLILELLEEAGFTSVYYRPHPLTVLDHGRGVYLAFRSESAVADLQFDPTNWLELSKHPRLFAPPPILVPRNPRNFLNFLLKRPLFRPQRPDAQRTR